MHASPVPCTPAFRRLISAVILTTAVLSLSGKTFAYDAPAQVSPEPLVGINPPLPQPPGGLNIQAIGTESATFDSNPLMLIQGGKALWGSVTAPELVVNDSTPTIKFTADTTLDENLFNLSEFDSTDIHSVADITDQKEQWAAEVQEHTDYDTTRTSELSTFGINQAAVRHFGFSLAPQISYSPTSVDRISLSGSGVISTYDSSVFTDYDVLSLTPSYSHNIDPLNAGVVSVQFQRYSTASGPNVTVDSVAPTIGWLGVLTPRITAKANVGLEGVRQYGAGTTSEPWTIDYVFSGDITFRGQQDVTDFNFSRSEFPFNNGTESLLTGVTLSETHTLNTRFSLNASGSYQTATYQSTATGSLDTLITGGGGLTYHATDHIDFTASYTYRLESLVGVSGSPQDHTGLLSVVYRPKAWTL